MTSRVQSCRQRTALVYALTPLTTYHTSTQTQSQRIIESRKEMSGNELKQGLQRALSSKDPVAIASVLELPLFPVSTSIKSTNRQRHKIKLSLTDNNGADWGNVLNSLVDAHTAALEVSDVLFLVTS